MNKLTMVQKQEYIKNSGHCPFCNSISIEGSSIEMDVNSQVYQEIFCHECKASWRDIYKLVKVEVIEKVLWN